MSRNHWPTEQRMYSLAIPAADKKKQVELPNSEPLLQDGTLKFRKGGRGHWREGQLKLFEKCLTFQSRNALGVEVWQVFPLGQLLEAAQNQDGFSLQSKSSSADGVWEFSTSSKDKAKEWIESVGSRRLKLKHVVRISLCELEQRRHSAGTICLEHLSHSSYYDLLEAVQRKLQSRFNGQPPARSLALQDFYLSEEPQSKECAEPPAKVSEKRFRELQEASTTDLQLYLISSTAQQQRQRWIRLDVSDPTGDKPKLGSRTIQCPGDNSLTVHDLKVVLAEKLTAEGFTLSDGSPVRPQFVDLLHGACKVTDDLLVLSLFNPNDTGPRTLQAVLKAPPSSRFMTPNKSKAPRASPAPCSAPPPVPDEADMLMPSPSSLSPPLLPVVLPLSPPPVPGEALSPPPLPVELSLSPPPVPLDKHTLLIPPPVAADENSLLAPPSVAGDENSTMLTPPPASPADEDTLLTPPPAVPHDHSLLTTPPSLLTPPAAPDDHSLLTPPPVPGDEPSPPAEQHCLMSPRWPGEEPDSAIALDRRDTGSSVSVGEAGSSGSSKHGPQTEPESHRSSIASSASSHNHDNNNNDNMGASSSASSLSLLGAAAIECDDFSDEEEEAAGWESQAAGGGNGKETADQKSVAGGKPEGDAVAEGAAANEKAILRDTPLCINDWEEEQRAMSDSTVWASVSVSADLYPLLPVPTLDEPEVWLGRSKFCHICLPLPYLALRHLVIRKARWLQPAEELQAGEQCYSDPAGGQVCVAELEVLGSHGVFLNGRFCSRGQKLLCRDKMEVKFQPSLAEGAVADALVCFRFGAGASEDEAARRDSQDILSSRRSSHDHQLSSRRSSLEPQLSSSRYSLEPPSEPMSAFLAAVRELRSSPRSLWHERLKNLVYAETNHPSFSLSESIRIIFHPTSVNLLMLYVNPGADAYVAQDKREKEKEEAKIFAQVTLLCSLLLSNIFFSTEERGSIEQVRPAWYQHVADLVGIYKRLLGWDKRSRRLCSYLLCAFLANIRAKFRTVVRSDYRSEMWGRLLGLLSACERFLVLEPEDAVSSSQLSTPSPSIRHKIKSRVSGDRRSSTDAVQVVPAMHTWDNELFLGDLKLMSSLHKLVEQLQPEESSMKEDAPSLYSAYQAEARWIRELWAAAPEIEMTRGERPADFLPQWAKRIERKHHPDLDIVVNQCEPLARAKKTGVAQKSIVMSQAARLAYQDFKVFRTSLDLSAGMDSSGAEERKRDSFEQVRRMGMFPSSLQLGVGSPGTLRTTLFRGSSLNLHSPPLPGSPRSARNTNSESHETISISRPRATNRAIFSPVPIPPSRRPPPRPQSSSSSSYSSSSSSSSATAASSATASTAPHTSDSHTSSTALASSTNTTLQPPASTATLDTSNMSPGTSANEAELKASQELASFSPSPSPSPSPPPSPPPPSLLSSSSYSPPAAAAAATHVQVSPEHGRRLELGEPAIPRCAHSSSVLPTSSSFPAATTRRGAPVHLIVTQSSSFPGPQSSQRAPRRSSSHTNLSELSVRPAPGSVPHLSGRSAPASPRRSAPASPSSTPRRRRNRSTLTPTSQPRHAPFPNQPPESLSHPWPGTLPIQPPSPSHHRPAPPPPLPHLNLQGCYQATNDGLAHLSSQPTPARRLRGKRLPASASADSFAAWRPTAASVPEEAAAAARKQPVMISPPAGAAVRSVSSPGKVKEQREEQCPEAKQHQLSPTQGNQSPLTPSAFNQSPLTPSAFNQSPLTPSAFMHGDRDLHGRHSSLAFQDRSEGGGSNLEVSAHTADSPEVTETMFERTAESLVNSNGTNPTWNNFSSPATKTAFFSASFSNGSSQPQKRNFNLDSPPSTNYLLLKRGSKDHRVRSNALTASSFSSSLSKLLPGLNNKNNKLPSSSKVSPLPPQLSNSNSVQDLPLQFETASALASVQPERTDHQKQWQSQSLAQSESDRTDKPDKAEDKAGKPRGVFHLTRKLQR